MTAEHYHALHSWMDAHPTAKRCVVALDRWLPLIPFVCYPVLLCLLNVRLFRLLGSQRQAALDLTAVIARTVFVPGLTFWGGTILRDRLNLPRPYEQPGFEPLRHKETRGHSFPSRHALSASAGSFFYCFLNISMSVSLRPFYSNENMTRLYQARVHVYSRNLLGHITYDFIDCYSFNNLFQFHILPVTLLI